MNGDIENLLHRYQPVAPPPELRARLIGAVRLRRTWPWLVASAALLALTIGTHMASNRLEYELQVLAPADSRAAQVAELERALGGGEDARGLAEQIILEREIDRALERASQPVGTTGAMR